MEGVFVFQRTARKMLQGQREGWNINRATGGTQPLPLIHLILLWFAPTNRPHPCRCRQKGEDDSDPPEKGGSL